MRRSHGLGQPCPEGQCVVRELGAVSTVANPSCQKQNLAMAGIAESKNPDIRAALDEESKTVPTIYTQNGHVPKVEYDRCASSISALIRPCRWWRP